jgi:hypothetical protein
MTGYLPPSLRTLTSVQFGISEDDLAASRTPIPAPDEEEIVRTSARSAGLISLSEFDRWKRLRQVGFL